MVLNYPIRHLQRQDFNDEGNLINKNLLKHKKKTFVMLQGSFCGWCQKAKPAFQEVGDKLSDKFFIATIQADGRISGEKECNVLFRKIDPTFRGFPTYLLFDEEGKYIKTHNGGRDFDSLKKFLET